MTPRGCSFICVIQILSASTAFAQIINAPTPHSGGINPYTVDGFALGARIDFETPTYRGYQCSPSEQFPDFTRCQRTQKQATLWRRSFESTSSIMHSRDGIAVYINRHIAAGVFDRSEVQNDINKLSSRFGERAREMRMPQREGLPNAVIASWGKIQLEPLDADAISILASGQSPHKGLLVDYLGDLRRSAQLGLPIYSLSGGAGYLWSASVDRNGRGHLRFLTVDASALNRPIATQPQQSETAETEKIALEKVTVDSQLAPVEPEKAKSEISSPTASDRLNPAAGRANTGAGELEQIRADNGANSDTFVARLEADLARAEARSQAMETLAYRAVVGFISLVVILAALLLVRRRKARAKSGQVQTSEIKLINPTQPDSIQPQPQRLSMKQKGVAAKDTSPAVILVENELNKECLQSAATNLRPCIYCNREISIRDKFCMHCGASAASTRLCSSCRNEIGAADRFCRHCGASSIAVAAPSVTFSSEGHNEVITNGVQPPPRKRKGKKKAFGHQTANSQADGVNPKEE